MSEENSVIKLLSIMEKLRSDNGCPWDRKQTYDTLKKYVLEEAYETIDAISKKDFSALKEEVGDLLLQVVFLSQIAKEDGKFDFYDVVNTLNEKLIRRHPHVFGNLKVKDSDEVKKNWEKIKKLEKKEEKSNYLHLPALIEALKLGEEAEKIGFDWNSSKEIFEKIKEELNELEKAIESGEKDLIDEEIGDLLFTISQISRKEKLNPELSLKKANQKFYSRFKKLKERINPQNKYNIKELDKIWEEIKAEEKSE